MTTITLPDDLAEQLNEIAQSEGRNLTELLGEFAESRRSDKPSLQQRHHALQSLIGMFDEDIPDFSSTIREQMDDFYRKKFGNNDDPH